MLATRTLRSRGSYSTLAAVATAVFFAPALALCNEPRPTTQETVEIKAAGDRSVRALIARPEVDVARPEVDTPSPVVIVLHEDRGFTAWERRLAEKIAAEGVIVIAPDLLSGAAGQGTGSDSFETTAAAREAIYKLKPESLAADLDAVFAHSQELASGNRRVFVVGFGWGGQLAFLYAAHNPDVAATIVFYGAAPDREQMQQIQAPVYGFYAETDARITGELSKIKAQMLETGRKFQARSFAGAKHGFFRSGDTKDANPADRKAREEAWARLLEILHAD